MTYAFLDTNVLLHYKVFEGMPWSNILKDSEVILVIPQKVIDELDKHKDGNKSKLRNRSKSILKILNRALDGEQVCVYTITTCKNPSQETTSQNGFDTSSFDEYILYSVYEFDAKDARKVLVTSDLGMKTRARRVQIETLYLDDDYRVAIEPTEEELKLKEVQSQLDRYLNRRSAPVVLFEDGSDKIKLTLSQKPDIESLLSDYRNTLLVENPHQVFRPRRAYGFESIDGILMTMNDPAREYFITQEDVDRYNSEIDEYINSLVNNRKAHLTLNFIDSRVHKIKLSIFNKGTSPTGNMGVQLNFPDEVIILSEDAFDSFRFSTKQKPILQSAFNKKLKDVAQQYQTLRPYQYHSSREDFENEKHWNIKKESEREIFFTAPSLNHNLNMDIESDKAKYMFIKKPGQYIIRWALSDESNIGPITGELVIVAE